MRESGRNQANERELLDLLANDSVNHEANYQLGMLYHQAGRNDLAFPRLQTAVNIKPGAFAARVNLGIIQHAEGLLADGQENLELALTIRPDSVEARVALALLLVDCNENVRAAAEIERALELDPDNAETLARLAWIFQLGCDSEKALSYFRKSIARRPDYGAAHHGLAYAQGAAHKIEDIGRMERALVSPEVAENDRMLIAYALGKVAEDQAEYDRAFDYWRRANAYQQRTQNFSLERQKSFFDRHRNAFDRHFSERFEEVALEDKTPIFVLGMPRSGTTLVEQVLASHPEVYGAGEVDYTRLLVDATEYQTGKPFPEDIDRVEPDILREEARVYIAKLRQNVGAATRVVDKLPHNFLRIPMLATLMPNATIVQCVRDPMDTCLSIYRHHFSSAHAYATDLTNLGQYHHLYEDLMACWHQLLPGKIYRIAYEDLVTDFESQVRKLLDHCDLAFDPRCLSFHKSTRLVHTPSASQVRKPIYKHALARWKRYENQLRPLRLALNGEQARL